MRGFGVTSASFAIELQMTRNANVLGIDPWEFRLKNANRPGDLMPTRKVLEDPSTIDTIQACAEAVGHPLSATYRDMRNEERSGEWLPAAPGRPGSKREARQPPGGSAMKHRGRGLAAIEYPTGMNQGGDPSQAWVKIKPDGRVDVFAGTVDLGQGSKTVHTQIVADTLGVPYESVNMDVSNTDSSPLCTGTFASRGTFIGGLAVLKAAKKAKEKMLEIAGQAMEIDPADLEVEDGIVFVKGSPDKRMSVGEVSAAATWGFGELITGTGVHLKAYSMPDPDTGECDPDHAISYAACVVDVEVDDETGAVTVLSMVQAYDVGHAINPTLVEGQIEGGAMMGLGLGLLEQSYPHYPSTEGRGNEFGAYLMPGLQDFPEITSVIVENPSADGPFGAKAIGEMADNAQGPAICSATRRRGRLGAAAAGDARARAARAAGQGRRHRRPASRGQTVVFDEDISVMTLGRLLVGSARSSGSDGRQPLPHLERRPHDGVPSGSVPARHRRRAGLPLQGDLTEPG